MWLLRQVLDILLSRRPQVGTFTIVIQLSDAEIRGGGTFTITDTSDTSDRSEE